MTPSVPDRGSGPRVRGWAKRGGGGEGSALEHPSGCECAHLCRFGAAHQRVHRYLCTSLHSQERAENQCRWKSYVVVWKIRSAFGYLKGRLRLWTAAAGGVIAT